MLGLELRMEESQESSNASDPARFVELSQLAMKRLSVREYGSGEMRSYLIRKGASEEQAERIVAELVDRKMIDDERYARVVARHQAFRDKGPSYVLMKLRQKGVQLPLKKVQEIFEETLPESAGSELEMARKVVERRYPRAHEDRAELRKAYQALLRRGFSRDVVRKCLFKSGQRDDELDEGGS